MLVVGPDFGRQLRDAVLGLCHVVETGVVHDRAGRAVRRRVGFRTERIHRHRIRGAEIVFQAEAVSQFVRRDEAHGVAHQLRGKLVAAGLGVYGAGLQANPRLEDAHHVVPPDDVGFDDLAAAGIDHRGAHGVGRLRGGIGHYRVAHVVDVELLVVGIDLPGHDGVLESGGLESLLPLDDALLDVGHPYGGRCRVDVQHDGLLGFHQLAALVTLHILGLGLQPPTVDECPLFGLLLFVVEIEVSDFEIAHALVGEAPHHRLLGQQHEVRGDVHGDGHRTALLAGVCARKGRFDDDVFGERFHGLDLRKVLFRGTADAERPEDVVETLLAAVEDLVDLDDHRRGIGVVSLDRELLDGRFAVVVLHRAGDAVAFGRGDARVVGHDPHLFIKGVLAEPDDLLAVAHALVDAAVVQGVGYARYFVDDQDVAAHQRVGYLEQVVRTLAVDIEQALVGHGAFQQLLVTFLLVFLERVGLGGGGFGFLRFAARLFGLRGSCCQQKERCQGSGCQGKSSCFHCLLLLGFFAGYLIRTMQ